MKHFLLYMFLFGAFISNAQVNKENLDAIDSLYQNTNGDNWIIKDKSELLKRTEVPRLVKAAFGSSTRIGEVLLVNNNLESKIPFTLARPYLTENSQVGIEYLNLAHNKINNINKYFWSVVRGILYIRDIDLSHNKLTHFNAGFDDKYVNPHAGISSLDLSFNNLKQAEINQWGKLKHSWLRSNFSKFDFSNNYLNFEEVIKAKNWATAKGNAIDANDNTRTIIYAPQARYGEVNASIKVNNGESISLEAKLPHPNNEYQWQLNGIDIPGATSSSYTIVSFTEKQAGCYVCKVTNSEAPDLTLFSHTFPVLAQGSAEIEDFNLPVTAVPPGLFKGAVVGVINGSDFYRLTQTETNRSFRIENGNILIANEDLFKYHFIKSYEIEIEAINKFGQTLKKIITITENPDLEGVNIISEFRNTFKDIQENTEAVVGSVSMHGYVNNTLQELNEYTLILPEGKADNNLFQLKGKQVSSGKLNYEERANYRIQLEAKHNEKDLSFITIIPIHVLNQNDTPHDIILTNNEIEINNIPNSVFAYLIASDEDKSDKEFNFKLVDEAEGNSFFFIEDNILKAKVSFTKTGIFPIKIQVDDAQGASFKKSFNIKVIGNIEEKQSPKDILISTDKMFSPNKNELLAYLSAEDDDSYLFKYDVIEGNVLSKGNTIIAKSAYTNDIQFKIRVTDESNLSFDKSFTLNYEQKEGTANLEDIGIDNFLIKESWEKDQIISNIIVKGSNQVNLSLEGENASYFKINEHQLVINKTPDLASYKITIVANQEEIEVRKEFQLFVPIVIDGVDYIDANEVSIYPNPVQNELYIQTNEACWISIYNIKGDLVKKTFVDQQKLNCSDLKKGMYFLKLLLNNETKTVKFLKK